MRAALDGVVVEEAEVAGRVALEDVVAEEAEVAEAVGIVFMGEGEAVGAGDSAFSVLRG